METRQPIGYLYGRPMYISDEPLFEPTTEIVMCQLTPEIAERVIGSMVADTLGKLLADEAPKVGM